MRPNHLNIDSSEEHRLKRIRCIAQGFLLRKFSDPKVTLEEKYKLSERIYLGNIKSVPIPEPPPVKSNEFNENTIKDQMTFLKGIKI